MADPLKAIMANLVASQQAQVQQHKEQMELLHLQQQHIDILLEKYRDQQQELDDLRKLVQQQQQQPDLQQQLDDLRKLIQQQLKQQQQPHNHKPDDPPLCTSCGECHRIGKGAHCWKTFPEHIPKSHRNYVGIKKHAEAWFRTEKGKEMREKALKRLDEPLSPKPATDDIAMSLLDQAY